MKQKPMVIITVFIAGLLSLSFIAFINNSFHLSREQAVLDGFDGEGGGYAARAYSIYG